MKPGRAVGHGIAEVRCRAPLEWIDDVRLDGASDANDPVVGGTLLAAWTDGRNGSDDVYFRAHPLGEFGKAPPEE